MCDEINSHQSNFSFSQTVTSMWRLKVLFWIYSVTCFPFVEGNQDYLELLGEIRNHPLAYVPRIRYENEAKHCEFVFYTHLGYSMDDGGSYGNYYLEPQKSKLDRALIYEDQYGRHTAQRAYYPRYRHLYVEAFNKIFNDSIYHIS